MSYRKMVLLLTLFFLLLSAPAFAQIEDTAQQRNPEFLTNADQLVEDLRARLTLNENQAKEVREILIDYQEARLLGANPPEVDKAEDSDLSAEDPNRESDMQNETDTAFQTPMDMNTDTAVTPPEEEDMMNNQDESDIGLAPDAQSADDPQVKANKAIEGVLNDTQRTTWSIISEAWWRDVNNRYGWGKNKMEY